MAFGFDSTDPSGFVSPTFNDLLLDFQAKFQAESGVLIDLNLKSPDLALLRFAARVFKGGYDDQAGTYASGFWATSAGVALRNLLFPLIGDPLPATNSVVVLPVTGDALSVIGAGSTCRLDSDGTLGLNWVLQADINLDGAGNGSGIFAYSEVGAKEAAAASAWVITSPLANWATVGPNAAAATLGTLAETDAEYRQRAELSALGRRLFAVVSAVPGVTAVTIFENPTNIPDAEYGMTHWIEVLVEGGDDQAIGDAIQSARCGGVKTVGSTLVAASAPGFAGGTVDIRFSRPTLIAVFIDLTIIKGEGYSGDTSAAAVTAREDAIKDSLVTWGNARATGLDLFTGQISAQVLATPSVPGIGDVNPKTVNGDPVVLVLAPREKAEFSAVNIVLSGV